MRALIIVAAFLLWVGTLAMLWRGRRWLLFYVTGALGAIIFVVLVSAITGLGAMLEAAEARQVLALTGPLGRGVVVLGSNGLAIRNHTGWGVFDIGIECSGLLEMTAMAGLVLFYPAVFSAARKAIVVVVGTGLTYIFNLARIMLIVAIVANLGTDWVFPAHAVFGRLFFFVVTIVLYWRLITLPTVRHVGVNLEPSPALAPAPAPATVPGLGDEPAPSFGAGLEPAAEPALDEELADGAEPLTLDLDEEPEPEPE